MGKDGKFGGVLATSPRHFYRAPCNLAVTVHLDPPGLSTPARLVNLGLGGAQIDLPHPPRLPVQASLTLPDRDPQGSPAGRKPLCLRGPLVWVVHDTGGGPNPSGMQFLTMDDTTRRRLHRLIGRLLVSPPLPPLLGGDHQAM